METLKEVMKAFPFAVRKDFGGFIMVAFDQGDGVWCGRAWRSADWKCFSSAISASSAEDVFSQFRAKIEILKQLVSL